MAEKGLRPEYISSAKARCIDKLKRGELPEHITCRFYDRIIEFSFFPAEGTVFERVSTIDWSGRIHHLSSTWNKLTRKYLDHIIETVRMTDKVECNFPEKPEKHWLFRDLRKKKLPLKGTLEPYVEAAKVKPLTEFIQPSQEWFTARKFTPLAVGSNFKPYKGCTLIESRPPSTSPTSLGKLMKAIEQGVVEMGEDYSKKALVYDEKDFMYKLIEVG